MEKKLYNYLVSVPFNTPAIIEYLKTQNQDVIASTRTLDRISDLGSLLRTLKKRDAITRDVLDRIVLSLDNLQICDKYLKIANGTTNNANELTSSPVSLPLNQRERVLRQPSQITDRLDRIYEIIIADMGKNYWRDFARSLGQPESMIDQLSGCNLHYCIQYILNEHERNCNKDNWRRELLGALDKIKRVKLRQKVEEKLDEFNIIQPKRSLT